MTKEVTHDLVLRERAKNGLKATRDYLAKPGHWTRDESKLHGNKGRTLCLMMALDREIRSPVRAAPVASCEAYNLALEIIQDDVFPDREGRTMHVDLLRWNDHPKRKKKDVLALLDRAIAKL